MFQNYTKFRATNIDNNLALGLEQLTEPIESLIGHIHAGFIRLNGTEREVHRRDGQFRESVEQSGFSDIGKSNLQKNHRSLCY